MGKTGNICKRRLTTLGVVALLVSAEMKTADAKAVVPQVALVDTTSQGVEETEVPQKPFVSIAQEDSILGRVEDDLRAIEEELKKLYSGDCENKGETISHLIEQLDECKDMELSINCTSHQEKIWHLREQLSAIESTEQKLKGCVVTSAMDTSEIIGLTEAEVEYILLSLQKETGEHLTEDKELAKELASAIVEGSKEYKVNELFVIAVMVLETGWLTNDLVHQNNFGGQRVDETGYLSYQTPREGMLKVVSSIRRNMWGNNTPKELGQTYCRMSDTDNLQWAEITLSLTRKCSKIGGGD